MILGQRVREIRLKNHLTQRDIRERCGLRRPYISRIENGYIIPTPPTLRKLADALRVPLHRIFSDEERLRLSPPRSLQASTDWCSNGEGARYLAKMRRLLSRISKSDRNMLLSFAKQLDKRQSLSSM